jgi:hypothetical protein
MPEFFTPAMIKLHAEMDRTLVMYMKMTDERCYMTADKLYKKYMRMMDAFMACYQMYMDLQVSMDWCKK